MGCCEHFFTDRRVRIFVAESDIPFCFATFAALREEKGRHAETVKAAK
jgi:hypothetical protein